MITLEDVRAHLGAAGDKWADETVSAVLAAELSAQRSVLDIPSPRPAEVDEALLRRVEHNLHQTNGDPLRRIGIRGEGVRDLEAPYSKRRNVHGEQVPPRTEPEPDPAPDAVEPTPAPKKTSSGKRTAAKKTAAKKAADSTETETS